MPLKLQIRILQTMRTGMTMGMINRVWKQIRVSRELTIKTSRKASSSRKSPRTYRHCISRQQQRPYLLMKTLWYAPTWFLSINFNLKINSSSRISMYQGTYRYSLRSNQTVTRSYWTLKRSSCRRVSLRNKKLSLSTLCTINQPSSLIWRDRPSSHYLIKQ